MNVHSVVVGREFLAEWGSLIVCVTTVKGQIFWSTILMPVIMAESEPTIFNDKHPRSRFILAHMEWDMYLLIVAASNKHFKR